MNKVVWKQIVGKTKWASGKRRLGKKGLCDLMSNALTLEKFMAQNQGNFAGADRSEKFKRNYNVSPL